MSTDDTGSWSRPNPTERTDPDFVDITRLAPASDEADQPADEALDEISDDDLVAVDVDDVDADDVDDDDNDDGYDDDDEPCCPTGGSGANNKLSRRWELLLFGKRVSRLDVRGRFARGRWNVRWETVRESHI